MNARQMLAFRQTLAAEGILLCYSGYLTEKVLTGIGDTLRQKLALENTDKRIARSVFHLFVELVQNVIRYSIEKEPADTEPGALGDTPPPGLPQTGELHYGLLTVGRLDGRHFVSCANLVNTADVPRMRDNLARLRSLSPEELKALYKAVLRDKSPEGSLGAGAGLIDIARTATQGFDFDFLEIDPDRSYFTLKAYI